MSKKIKAEEYSKWDKNVAKQLLPLEAFERIKLCCIYEIKEDTKIVETALKRLAKYERDWLKHHDEFNKKAIAIEIIKKNVNVKQLLMAIEMNGVLGSELELLKEVLL